MCKHEGDKNPCSPTGKLLCATNVKPHSCGKVASCTVLHAPFGGCAHTARDNAACTTDLTTHGRLLQPRVGVTHALTCKCCTCTGLEQPLPHAGWESQYTRWDPKGGELCLGRTKPGETLVEVRSVTDVQIVRQT